MDHGGWGRQFASLPARRRDRSDRAYRYPRRRLPPPIGGKAPLPIAPPHPVTRIAHQTTRTRINTWGSRVDNNPCDAVVKSSFRSRPILGKGRANECDGCRRGGLYRLACREKSCSRPDIAVVAVDQPLSRPPPGGPPQACFSPGRLAETGGLAESFSSATRSSA